MRLTTRTSLAMRALMVCAADPGRPLRRAEIAEACGASPNHMALVVNRLSRAGLLATTRGRGGGVRLGRRPETISVGEVARLLEAEVPFADCFAQGAGCPLAGACQLGAALCAALDAFYSALDRVTLADLTEDNDALARLLQAGGQAPAANDGDCRRDAAGADLAS